VPVFEGDESREERRRHPDDFRLPAVFDVGMDERQSQFSCYDEHRIPQQQGLSRWVVFKQLHHRRTGVGGCRQLHNIISALLVTTSWTVAANRSTGSHWQQRAPSALPFSSHVRTALQPQQMRSLDFRCGDGGEVCSVVSCILGSGC